MDLQRALDNKYFEFTGVYLDNRGQAKLVGGDTAAGFRAGDAEVFKSVLRDTVLALGGALTELRGGSDVELLAQDSVHNVARFGDIADIVKELRLQELAFAKEGAAAAKTCGY